MKIKERKLEHIKIALQKDVQFSKKTTGFEDVGFEGVELVYKALPEMRKIDVNTETSFLGKKFSAPLIVASMTGGIKEAEKINKDVAKACENLQLGMGLGSQRAMIEIPSLTKTYKVRNTAPKIFLAGNLGVVQAKDYPAKKIEEALKKVGADALCLHVNAAQESVQTEGTTDFSKGIGTINRLSNELAYPIIVKEVGHGISKEIASELAKTKIAAIDVGGAGGTSWVAIDSMRNEKNAEIGKTYWDFGIPTAVSIIETRAVFNRPVIATGGIRTGLDCVKAIVLGAELCGIALPVLKAQQKGGAKAVQQYLEKIIEEIKIGMFLVGAKNLGELKNKKYLLFGKTKEWIEQRKD